MHPAVNWRVRNALMAALLLTATVSQPASAATSGDGQRLLGPNGTPLFITGMNYEGPADRAWQMWDNDKFDPNLIDADFRKASETAGVNVLRIFVQASLAADIAAGKWDKLDKVVDLAEAHHLQLIVSLHDYGERDLSKVSAIGGQIAQRYRNRSGILAFDLKNEPRFGDLALTKYAAAVPLQQHGLIDAFGEQLPRDQLADYRASEDGVKSVPSTLSDDDAYIYVNNLRLYRAMLADGAAWVNGHGGTTLDFLDAAAGQKWAPLVAALNQSLQAWIQPQLAAIKAADPTRAVTVDHVDVVLARQPANDVLDFESLHRYPSASGSSIRANLSLLTSVERAHAGKPFVLSEFGYATDSLDADKASLDETAIELGLLAQHAAGGAKWMLNDMPPGFNQRERTLGAFQVDGTPKPIVGALAALRKYLDTTGSQPGTVKLDDDPETGARYVYRADDALLLGGKNVDAGAASFQAGAAAQLFLTWTRPGVVDVWASAPLSATVDLNQLLGGSAPHEVRKLSLAAGSSSIQVANGTVTRAADYDVPSGHFFTQTNGNGSMSGFSVTDQDGVPLWTGFRSLGGADVLGYPVSRRFSMDGFVVQAFQKSVLQWRPDQKSFAFLNTFDVMHDRGLDNWLAVYRQTPPPLDTAADKGLPFPGVMARHVALLDAVPPALKSAFLADPDWLDHYGLPVATQEDQTSVVVRAQRAALQYWKVGVPWAAQGTVTVANGGDLAKEAGVFPWPAVTPENAPR
ncbi:MAG: cellulase family glycosylhydrolase [Chloroflexi bacterium]|nr:cellulase family glycosylhydrolase [Chloroflexota bacterium]